MKYVRLKTYEFIHMNMICICISSLKGGRVTGLIKTTFQKTDHDVLSGDPRRP